ncbi:glutamate--tRNA ligase [Tepidicaulis sp. LMO-SS28]|uniref:glutamate--tRNA ligase n=1 Tax=Tepidicaulis sp. LMO-SS28 TaxID=3447455 RepID=UPI003EE26DF8
MTVTVRFAPSPTGKLHIGNGRPAVLNWLYAKSQGGTFILRLDDTDRERSTEEYADGILEDLAWLGLEHDALHRQSARFERYDAAAQRLKQAGRLYPCYETPDELDRKRKRQLARGLPPVYDRAALDLTDEEREKLEAEGRRPHWRFKLEPKTAEWDDLILGTVRVDCKSLSDPVLIREDGSYLYTLPSVVDDMEMNVTDVIRGDDHTTNTGAQIQIFEALAARLPRFGHHSMLIGPDGKPLSKRLLGDYTLEAIRGMGFEPMAVNCMLALLGTAEAAEPLLTLDELAKGFDIAKLGRGQIRFEAQEIERLNAGLLHKTPYEAVKARLAERGMDSPEFWEAVRPNLTLFDGAAEWWHVIEGPVEPVIEPEDADFIAEALAALPGEPWDGSTWKSWTDTLKSSTGRKGKGLFMPLRLALTGLRHGPELANLLPLIGPERAKARLSGKS